MKNKNSVTEFLQKDFSLGTMHKKMWQWFLFGFIVFGVVFAARKVFYVLRGRKFLKKNSLPSEKSSQSKVEARMVARNRQKVDKQVAINKQKAIKNVIRFDPEGGKRSRSERRKLRRKVRKNDGGLTPQLKQDLEYAKS